MNNSRYEFKVNPLKTECAIFLKRPSGKYVGKIILAASGHFFQEFAPDVMWLPTNQALAALGVRSAEAEQETLRELGY